LDADKVDYSVFHEGKKKSNNNLFEDV